MLNCLLTKIDRPVVVIGERGSGKIHALREELDDADKKITVLDASVCHSTRTLNEYIKRFESEDKRIIVKNLPISPRIPDELVDNAWRILTHPRCIACTSTVADGQPIDARLTRLVSGVVRVNTPSNHDVASHVVTSLSDRLHPQILPMLSNVIVDAGMTSYTDAEMVIWSLRDELVKIEQCNRDTVLAPWIKMTQRHRREHQKIPPIPSPDEQRVTLLTRSVEIENRYKSTLRDLHEAHAADLAALDMNNNNGIETMSTDEDVLQSRIMASTARIALEHSNKEAARALYQEYQSELKELRDRLNNETRLARADIEQRRRNTTNRHTREMGELKNSANPLLREYLSSESKEPMPLTIDETLHYAPRILARARGQLDMIALINEEHTEMEARCMQVDESSEQTQLLRQILKALVDK